MESNKNKVTDVFGLAPYGDAIKIAVEKSFEGASALLSRICLPAAEELGLMMKDKVRFWRLKNILSIINKAEGKIAITAENTTLSIHPRVINEIMETGSWCDDDSIQEMWAGLICSACSPGNNSDRNLLFIQTLKLLTTTQAKLINHICTLCKVAIHQSGLLQGVDFMLTLEEVKRVTEVQDLDQLDSELDMLRSRELIGRGTGGGGFIINSGVLVADLTATAFLLNFFAKTQGFQGSLWEFYLPQTVEVDILGNPINSSQ